MSGLGELLVVDDGHGRQWISTEGACVLLRVDRKTVNDWVRRSLREPDFPRVDQPRRVGSTWWYVLEDLAAAEAYTAAATRGQSRADA